MARRARVLRLATAGPSDTASLATAIDKGEVDPATIVAIVGKTECNGCVNDFTRGYATLALKLLLAERLKCLPSEIEKRVAVVMSGGTEGGMSTGEVLRVRAAMKPIATVPRALRTVDTATGEAAVAHHQRSDVCAVPAAGVVAEAMVALVLADAVLEKFGGDAVEETRRNVESYLDHLPDHLKVR